MAGLPGCLSNIHSRLDTRNWALPPAIPLIFKNLGREERKGRVEKRQLNLKRQITGTKLIMSLRRRLRSEVSSTIGIQRELPPISAA